MKLLISLILILLPLIQNNSQTVAEKLYKIITPRQEMILNKLFPFWKKVTITGPTEVTRGIASFNPANNQIQLGEIKVSTFAHELMHYYQFNYLGYKFRQAETYDPDYLEILKAINNKSRINYGKEADIVGYLLEEPYNEDMIMLQHISLLYLQINYNLGLSLTLDKDSNKKKQELTKEDKYGPARFDNPYFVYSNITK